MTSFSSPATRELDGKVAIVTGGSRNIGRAIALELAAAGAAVVVNAQVSQASADDVVSRIEAGGGQALPVLADVSKEEAVAQLIARTLERFGRIDILVNNASLRYETPFAQLELAQWHAVLGVVLDGTFLCSKAVLPHLQAGASIVNIGGLSGSTGARNRADAVTAKAGLIGLTRALAHELADSAVTVNCVVPGLIETVRERTSPAHSHHHATRTNLVGHWGQAQDIAGAVRYLAGPAARYVTGQTLHVNGGAFLGG